MLVAIVLITFLLNFIPIPCNTVNPTISSNADVPYSDVKESLRQKINEDEYYEADDSDDETDEDLRQIPGRRSKNRSNQKSDPAIVARYGYALKILANSFLVGIGTYIKAGWVLSSFCLFDTNITKYHKVAVETWNAVHSSRIGGQSRAVTKIMPHPKYSEKECNYDVILMKLITPFQLEGGVSIVTLISEPQPPLGSKCVIPAPFDKNIILTTVIVNDISDCKNHEEYEKVIGCKEKDKMFCMKMSEELYGGPVVCAGKVVGILPTNMDTNANLTMVQFVRSYTDWIDSNINIRVSFRSSEASIKIFKFRNHVYAYCHSILSIIIMSIII